VPRGRDDREGADGFLTGDRPVSGANTDHDLDRRVALVFAAAIR